jgi:polyisoprenyl-teichoic acid--peptidoglycan teichoic acid transferase
MTRDEVVAAFERGDGPDGGATYRLREGDTRTLVTTHLAGSIPLGGGGVAVRVQVLNGVGVPGVGQEVDRLLDRGAFRIVLSDNARSFDFDATQILVYDESERSLAAAQRVQELLGVGTIQVSRQPQSVIDLTIVVGSDFVEAHEALGD